MKGSFKQKERSDMWNKMNKLKRFHFIHSSAYINVPKEYMRELDLSEFMLMTLDLANQRIILTPVKNDTEEFKLPEKQVNEGWVNE